MIEDGDCFFFALDEQNGSATAFRTEIGQETLTDLKSNFSRIMNSKTTERQYRQSIEDWRLEIVDYSLSIISIE